MHHKEGPTTEAEDLWVDAIDFGGALLATCQLKEVALSETPTEEDREVVSRCSHWSGKWVDLLFPPGVPAQVYEDEVRCHKALSQC